MLYSKIVGQQEAKDRLIKMVNSSRVPHALMFIGRDGCGHLAAALAFAQHLFCKNKQMNGACGECPSCSKVSKLIHLRMSSSTRSGAKLMASTCGGHGSGWPAARCSSGTPCCMLPHQCGLRSCMESGANQMTLTIQPGRGVWRPRRSGPRPA